jgi:diphosphomevalonate decarboxylase
MRAIAQAQPNIALIKYWGKRDIERNLPAVSSLSITLDSLWTKMSVEFGIGSGPDDLVVNGMPEPRLLPRVSACIDALAGERRPRANIVSEGNFPIAAGLASSASAFAALTVAAGAACGANLDTLSLARIAGAASGSAARSLFGGFVELKAGDTDIDVATITAASDWPLTVVVAITAEGAKPISSGDAMLRSAATSPFYAAWLAHQSHDLDLARAAVLQRDFAELAAVAEHNCLKMHSVMWASRPPIVYWNSATLDCMQTIRILQAGGCPVFFTIDAGPQLKAVCLPGELHAVRSALENTAGVQRTMVSGLGSGARLLERV